MCRNWSRIYCRDHTPLILLGMSHILLIHQLITSTKHSFWILVIILMTLSNKSSPSLLHVLSIHSRYPSSLLIHSIDPHSYMSSRSSLPPLSTLPTLSTLTTLLLSLDFSKNGFLIHPRTNWLITCRRCVVHCKLCRWVCPHALRYLWAR